MQVLIQSLKTPGPRLSLSDQQTRAYSLAHIACIIANAAAVMHSKNSNADDNAMSIQICTALCEFAKDADWPDAVYEHACRGIGNILHRTSNTSTPIIALALGSIPALVSPLTTTMASRITCMRALKTLRILVRTHAPEVAALLCGTNDDTNNSTREGTRAVQGENDGVDCTGEEPISFAAAAKKGFQSSSFDLSENLSSGDARGLAVAELEGLMKDGTRTFDEARVELVRRQMIRHGINPETGSTSPSLLSQSDRHRAVDGMGNIQETGDSGAVPFVGCLVGAI